MISQTQLRKRMMSYSKKKLGAERAYRYRDKLNNSLEKSYVPLQKLHTAIRIRTEIALYTQENKLVLTSRFIDPEEKSERIGLRYTDNSTQWIDDNVAHFRSSDKTLSKLSLPPTTPDQLAGVVQCEQDCKNISQMVVRTKDGKEKTIPLKPQQVSGDPLQTIKHLLNLIAVGETRKRELYDHVFGEMIGTLWSARSKTGSESELIRYNETLSPKTPAVSLVIPVYGRYDFINHQLSQFASDPDMKNHEIIYVIDDPRIASEVRESCHWLAPILHIAFNVLYLEKNLGYAGANNAGAKVATADKLLLLNSDVFPCEAGWLGELVDSAGDALDTTLVGARLLYEDESIQHDGMSFNQAFWLDNLWINEHYGKGLPANLFGCSKVIQSRECVTGACMLITKSNYDTLGGFDEDYILGDFEDSDLCLKGREIGLQVAIAEDISLYHLERQSQSMVSPERWKTELTYYNCWQHTHKWNGQIIDLKKEMAHV